MPVDLDKLFDDISKLKVAIIGDIMLDTYWWGHVDRISPEAPVPIVLVDKKEQRIGGAGNVALNIQALGANAEVVSITGNDEEAGQLKKLLKQNKINIDFILSSGKRITTNKIRIISRNQQMMRIDAEISDYIKDDEENNLCKHLKIYIEKNLPDVVILQDYNKGVLSETIIKSVIELCRQKKIICAVDPKRKNFFTYKDVSIFKPNLKEVRESLNILSEEINTDQLDNIHGQLTSKLHHAVSLITLSDKGIFYNDGNSSEIIPAHIRNVADVSGAGDTVIAVASLVYAATKNVKLMAEIANIAGGLVCEEVGTAAIRKDQLLNECQNLLN